MGDVGGLAYEVVEAGGGCVRGGFDGEESVIVVEVVDNFKFIFCVMGVVFPGNGVV